MWFQKCLEIGSLHWRLIVTTLFHGIIGGGTISDTTMLNPMVTWVKDLANRSVSSHYDLEPSESVLEWLWASTTVLYMLGATVGSLTLKYPAELLGRRATVMVLKSGIGLLSVALQTLSRPLNSFELLLLGRFVSGIAVAQASLAPVFVAECTPIKYRGFCATATVAVAVGLSQMVGLVTASCVDEETWNYAFLALVPFLLIYTAASPLIPESISHTYITEGKQLSRKTSAFYHGSQVDSKRLETAMTAEAEVAPTNRRADLRSTWAAPQLRWPLVLCCVLSCTAAFSGYPAALFYSTSTLVAVGVPQASAATYTVLIVFLPGFILSLVVVCIVEIVGRRPLVLLGYLLLVLGSVCYFLSTPVGPEVGRWFKVFAMCLTISGMRIGPGVVGDMMPGELAPQTSRSLTCGVANALCWGGGIVVGLGFPPVSAVLQSYCFVPFVLFNVLSFVFMFLYLPETKNKTVREIVQPWMPARKDGHAQEETGI